MADEDEVGQEFDRVLRSLMMGGGQMREQLARAQMSKDQQVRENALAQIRQREQETNRLHSMVSRESFWATANGERVANAATYGATLYNTDPNAAAVYDIVSEKVQQRYGINVHKLRAEHPVSEDERHAALLHAVDDRLAAARDRDAADQARARADSLEQQAAEARDESRPANEDEQALDDRAGQLDDRAEDERTAAATLDADADRAASHAAGDESSARTAERGTVHEQVSASYPKSANATLAQSRKVKQPKSRSKKSNTRPGRGSGLSR